VQPEDRRGDDGANHQRGAGGAPEHSTLSANPGGATDGQTLSAIVGADALGNDMFRMLVSSVRDYAIFLLNPQGIVASWNVGAQRIKGYSAEEIIGQHFSRFYTADALAMDWPAEELRRARRDGRLEDEGWRVRSDGTRFWANVIITPMFSPGGELLGFSKITRDLTERREHEEQLRQSEENLRSLVEGVKDHAIFPLDADGLVAGWNAGASRLTGFRDDDVVGRHWRLFFTEDDCLAGKPQTALDTAALSGAAQSVGWRLRKDGSRFWAESRLTLLRNRDGMARGFVHIVRDLTERRRVQELENEGQRINEFIAMLAHELRNPLAPIGNAVGIIDKVATTPQLTWCARLISRQVMHMTRLVDDLLDASRITSGKIQLRMEPLVLNEVVAAAVESVRSVVTSYGHTLDVHLPDEPIVMTGDPTRLTQVVVNLLNNAAKYTPNGGRVFLQVERYGMLATIRVVDNGIGMSADLIESAFDLFVQGERTLDRAEGGLGIGLPLVRRIAVLHGGTVTAHSAGHGLGSEFTVMLPIDPAAPEN